MRNPSIILALTCVLALAACRKIPEPNPDEHGYPEEIGEILVRGCTETGCHDDNSHEQEGRLSLTTWDKMFEGSRAGAAVIPHRIDESYLLFFINQDSTLGITQTPLMPLGRTPLTTEEYIKVRDWIAAGAPDKDGNIKWADNPGRDKIYVLNQGCDQVSVLDRETRLVMRYADVGNIEGFVESPHMIKISPDGRYWYVVFLVANDYIEKYDAVTDELVGRVNIGNGGWNTLDISPDGKYCFAVDYDNGRIALANMDDLVLENHFSVGGNPHGSSLNKDFTALYITQQEGDELNRLEFTDPKNPTGLENIDLVQWAPRTVAARAMGPHEVKFTPDGSRYLVTCQYQSEVRIFQSSNDSLLKVISVGAEPVELDFSAQYGLAFVTCMEDTSLNAGDPLKRGSVAIIDYRNMSLVKEIYSGYQPHGVAVDEEKGLVYISNRNANPNGPAPHHTTDCGGRNGTITAIRLQSLDLLPGFRHELSVDPYSVAIRF